VYDEATRICTFPRRFQRGAPEAFSEEFVPITQILAEDIVIVGYLRSGNRWFQNLIAGELHGIGPRFLPTALVHDLVLERDVGKYRRRYAMPMYFESHALPLPEHRRVVYLLRDGRDAMVSYRHYREAIDGVEYDFLNFVSPETRPYPCHWAAHVDARTNDRYRAQMSVIKYEDLIGKSIAELRRLCEFAGVSREPEHLPAIAEAAACRYLHHRE
jgi:Sulfotransferase domain